MLNYIGIGVRCAISSAARFWILGMPMQHCGRLFGDTTLALNITDSVGLFAVQADFGGLWLVTRSIRQFFVIGVCGGSVTSEKARVLHFRANVEGNG